MSNNQMEPATKETLGIEQLIELERERANAWIEILNVIKEELRKSIGLNDSIVKLDERLGKLEDNVSVTKGTASNLTEILDQIPENIPKGDLEKFGITLGILRLLPKEKTEILESYPEDLYLKDILQTTNGREIHKKVKTLENTLIKELHDKGVTQLKKGKNEDAYECFDKITNINSKIKEAWLNKGVALGRSGQIEKEIVCYARAIEIEKKYPKALYNKGVALKKISEEFTQ